MASDKAVPETCARNWDNWGHLRTLTESCHYCFYGWSDDFWQGLIGCQRQLSPECGQVAEMIGDTRELLEDPVLTFYHATVVLVSSSSEITDFTVIWDHSNNTEQEGSDDHYHTAYTRIWAAERIAELDLTNVLEYVPRYVLGYLPSLKT
jgi:hypothetical protein